MFILISFFIQLLYELSIYLFFVKKEYFLGISLPYFFDQNHVIGCCPSLPKFDWLLPILPKFDWLLPNSAQI